MATPAAHLRALLLEAARRAFGPGERPALTVFRERDPARADFATNWPMRLARPLGRAPEAIARALADALPPDGAIGQVTPAAGYLNFRLAEAWLAERLADRLEGAAAGPWDDRPASPFKEAGLNADESLVGESLDDPAFYLAYTRARLRSLLRLAASEGLPGWGRGDGVDLADPLARALVLAVLADEPDARAVAAAFHRFYADRRVFGQPADVAAGRLALLRGTWEVLDRDDGDKLC